MLVFSNHKLKLPSKAFAMLVLLAALVLPASSLADQIKITDADGNPKFLGEVDSGAEATLIVSLASVDSSVENVVVKMLKSKNGNPVQQATTDANGLAKFQGISSGSYVLEPNKPSTIVASVKMLPALAPKAQSAKTNSTAMYVGGVTAIAGGAIAIAASESSSSGGGSDVGGSGLSDVGRDGGVESSASSAAQTAAAEGDIAAFALTDTAPVPSGGIQPSVDVTDPNVTTVNTTPPVDNSAPQDIPEDNTTPPPAVDIPTPTPDVTPPPPTPTDPDSPV